MKNFDLIQDNKVAKTNLRVFCKTFETQIDAQFNEMRRNAKTKDIIKALNIRFCGNASQENINLPTFYIEKFSKYIDKEGRIYKKVKGVYKERAKTGISAKGILKDALLNAIESCRTGSKFEQIIVNI